MQKYLEMIHKKQPNLYKHGKQVKATMKMMKNNIKT